MNANIMIDSNLFIQDSVSIKKRALFEMHLENLSASRTDHEAAIYNDRRRLEVVAEMLLEDNFAGAALDKIDISNDIASHDEEFIVLIEKSHRR